MIRCHFQSSERSEMTDRAPEREPDGAPDVAADKVPDGERVREPPAYCVLQPVFEAPLPPEVQKCISGCMCSVMHV